ncbi:MAG: potassium-transporting ATPase subunit F [Actinomycetota bacterium]|nr:potassium-transporting ATPase subunit F [Actinomycetota bacterium]
MSPANLVSVIVALAISAYLVFALLRGERF